MRVVCIETPPAFEDAPCPIKGQPYNVPHVCEKGTIIIYCGHIYTLPKDYYVLIEFNAEYMYASSIFVLDDRPDLSEITIEDLLQEVKILQPV